MPRSKYPRRPKGADPYAADVPEGHVRCLRCAWPFPTRNRRTNRICPRCTELPPLLSRRELAECGGGVAVVRGDYA